MNNKALIEKRAALLEEAQGMINACEAEARALNEEESVKYAEIFEEVRKLNDEPTKEELAEAYKLYQEKTDPVKAMRDLKAFIDNARQGYGEVWETGFSGLDRKLDGGFLGGQLIFLGAISSLGKTSFGLQAATQLAEQGKDVLIFSLEMSREELLAKTISRYTHILTEHDKNLRELRLTTRDILSGRIGNVAFDQAADAQGKVFLDAYNALNDISKNLRIFVGEADVDVDIVREVVDTHIRMTKRKPIVFLDYLQILQASEEAKTADKRLLTDYDVTRLKLLARDYDIPVFVISAFNRSSYLDPVSMGSFRESSGIEYSSDILLAMQYKGMEYKNHWFTNENGSHKLVFENKQEHDTRVRLLLENMNRLGSLGQPLPIELVILKNRNGAKGSVYYDFLPAYNFFSESENQNSDDHALEWDSEISSEDSPSSVVSSGKPSYGVV